VRCGRCGNDNSAGNRFCGMCGASLVPKTQSAGASAGQVPGAAEVTESRGPESRRAVAPPPQSPPPLASPMQPAARPLPSISPSGAANSPSEAAERRPVTLSSFEVARDDEPEREPIISGPSFLGLNKPAPRRAGFHADRPADGARDHLRSSGSVDYLLDDEEEPKRGWGKLILIVVALALAAGFGYLRWKQGGFDWLKALEKKPAAMQPAPDAAQNSGDNAAPPGVSTPRATSPAAGSTSAPPTQSTTPAPTEPAAAPPQTSPTSSTPSSSATTPPDNPPQNNPASASQVPAPSSKASDAGTPPDSASPTTDSDSDSHAAQPSDDEQPAAPKAVGRKPSATRPLAAKPSAAKPIDTVAEAEHYVYGSGVHQDCDRGLRMLKTSAGQSDAKAMISLGALYSTGTCAPRDLPTAYRWFALALHKQPDNLSLQDNLQKLWSQMTQPERQLAIKLSQ
jgi:hypothetical protein